MWWYLVLTIWSRTVYAQSFTLLRNINNKHVYTNKWVVHTKEGEGVVKGIAERHNFTYRGQLGSLKHFYHLEHDGVLKLSLAHAREHHTLLSNQPGILWLNQQRVKSRVKRGPVEYFSDPLYNQQWYLDNVGNRGRTRRRCGKQTQSADHHFDINVLPAWKSNHTGRGVVVSILDDGIEYTHPDLKKNYDYKASYDYNSHDHDPFPRYSIDNINKHGTRCAGEVAAEINNGICGVGVAFNAKVGGIRMLDGEVTDAIEAGSLSFRSDYIDIYSSSWGPDDDGRTVDGPGPLARKAFKDGAEHGRRGLGSIYVWATGNGGRYADYCSCDGYINSPYTISIGAVDGCGRKPWYAEECPSTLAVTFSSGEATGNYDKQISTTDLHGGCTQQHTGTSAAAPLAAGIFALVLEANPKLTWRDMQHLVVKTSKVISPEDKHWQVNGAGHKVNAKFGFGSLDTNGLVQAAAHKDWETALPQRICSTERYNVNMKLRRYDSIETTIDTNGCSNSPNHVTRLEHVHVIITLVKRWERGKLDITLTSPSGTRSAILRRRRRDTSSEGFTEWAFLTVFHWDEHPKGKWKLTVNDHSSTYGRLVSWRLKFYGTYERRRFADFHKVRSLRHANDA